MIPDYAFAFLKPYRSRTEFSASSGVILFSARASHKCSASLLGAICSIAIVDNVYLIWFSAFFVIMLLYHKTIRGQVPVSLSVVFAQSLVRSTGLRRKIGQSSPLRGFSPAGSVAAALECHRHSIHYRLQPLRSALQRPVNALTSLVKERGTACGGEIPRLFLHIKKRAGFPALVCLFCAVFILPDCSRFRGWL